MSDEQLNRKHKLTAKGCLVTLGIILGVIILVLCVFFGAIILPEARKISDIANYLKSMSDDDIQKWIAQTEVIIQNGDTISRNYDYLPSNLAQPLTYFSDTEVFYHWCIGITCANLTVKKLPEGGYEVIADCRGNRGMNAKRLWPKEEATPCIVGGENE